MSEDQNLDYREIARINLERMLESKTNSLKLSEFLDSNNYPLSNALDIAQDLEAEHLIEEEDGEYFLTPLGYEFLEQEGILNTKQEEESPTKGKVQGIIIVLAGAIALFVASSWTFSRPCCFLQGSNLILLVQTVIMN